MRHAAVVLGFGRPKALSPEAIERLRRLIASGKSHRYIASMLRVGKGTVQRECARLGRRAVAA